ncbi:MAG: hypothetical protein RIT26_2070 [Pseudomonadota bacterium]|jgi:phosphatidate cytidylyltransferase
MLRQRIITALWLVALFLPALFHPRSEWLAGLSLVLISLAGWEWGRLMGCGARVAVGLGLACLGACLITWALAGADGANDGFWLAISLLWLFGGAWMLRWGLTHWMRLPLEWRCALGVLVLWSTWWALWAAKSLGTQFLLSVLLLVWVADISAYFCGRAFGRRKLAASISPGKSWEGVAGAVLGVGLLAAAWLWWDAQFPSDSPSLYTVLMQRGWGIALLGVVWLTAMSVVGDLVESLVKRCAGVKDSSALLPGHGGVLDRVDALLPVFPLALCLNAWVNA